MPRWGCARQSLACAARLPRLVLRAIGRALVHRLPRGRGPCACAVGLRGCACAATRVCRACVWQIPFRCCCASLWEGGSRTASRGACSICLPPLSRVRTGIQHLPARRRGNRRTRQACWHLPQCPHDPPSLLLALARARHPAAPRRLCLRTEAVSLPPLPPPRGPLLRLRRPLVDTPH